MMVEIKCDDVSGCMGRLLLCVFFFCVCVVDVIVVVVFVVLSVFLCGVFVSVSVVKMCMCMLIIVILLVWYEKCVCLEMVVLVSAVDDRRRAGSWTRRVDKALFDVILIFIVFEGWCELVCKFDVWE